MAVMEKYPEPLETVVRVSPESSFFSVTFALATTAPLESMVVPVKVPVSCWPKHSEASRTNTTRLEAAPTFFQVEDVEVIEPPPNLTFLPGIRASAARISTAALTRHPKNG